MVITRLAHRLLWNSVFLKDAIYRPSGNSIIIRYRLRTMKVLRIHGDYFVSRQVHPVFCPSATLCVVVVSDWNSEVAKISQNIGSRASDHCPDLVRRHSHINVMLSEKFFRQAVSISGLPICVICHLDMIQQSRHLRKRDAAALIIET